MVVAGGRAPAISVRFTLAPPSFLPARLPACQAACHVLTWINARLHLNTQLTHSQSQPAELTPVYICLCAMQARLQNAHCKSLKRRSHRLNLPLYFHFTVQCGRVS